MAIKQPAPTIADVAERAGVSLATASRALSSYGRVAASTVERVRAAATELGYRPNELARSMRLGATKTIGLVIIADFTNAFFDRATKAIVDAARIHGYQVLITNTDEDVEVEKRAIDVLLDKQVDGFIVVPSLTDDYGHLTSAALGRRPVVVIDRRIDAELSTVTTDDYSSARDVVMRAVELGHERLGFLVAAIGVAGWTTAEPAEMLSTARDRAVGFRAGAEAAGIPARAQSWYYCEDEPEALRSAVQAMLDEPDRPSVIFTSNNDMALGVLSEAGRRRISIGRELSLVTVDDSQWAAAIEPPITVIARPVEELGRLAVDTLVAEIEQPDAPRTNVVLPTEIIERRSLADRTVDDEELIA